MATRPAPKQADRRRYIAAIHASASKLGMDTADKNPASDYRSMLQSVGGASSTTEMNLDALQRVTKHLGKLTKPKDGWHAEKMRQLWRELDSLQALNDPTERGLQRFVESQTGRSALRFLSSHEGNRIVETLKAWLARERAKV